ncbi:MAG TPA: DUF6531 domain-containing protein, partial [Phototrophicaceae bacterium]|nr:DUF6531 domain-containing protein [Phototrophicaceae bacterium]
MIRPAADGDDTLEHIAVIVNPTGSFGYYECPSMVAYKANRFDKSEGWSYTFLRCGMRYWVHPNTCLPNSAASYGTNNTLYMTATGSLSPATMIYKSTDGGANWQPVKNEHGRLVSIGGNVQAGANGSSLYISRDDNTDIAVVRHHLVNSVETVLYSEDAALNWASVQPLMGDNLDDSGPNTMFRAYASEGDPGKLTSDNAGAPKLQSVLYIPSYANLYPVDPLTGEICFDDPPIFNPGVGVVLVSYDFGKTWKTDGSFPFAKARAYGKTTGIVIVNPQNTRYRMAANSDFNNNPAQDLNFDGTISVTNDGINWEDKTGDWLYDSSDNRRQNWAGGRLFLTASSFVRVPGESKDNKRPDTGMPENATAGDNCGSCSLSNADNQVRKPGDASDPIDTYSGNYWYNTVDLEMPGRQNLLTLKRVYSVRRTNFDDSVFGQGWTHNYNIQLLFPDPKTVVFQGGNGSRQNFTFDSNTSTYTAEKGLLADLVKQDGSTYRLTLVDQTQFFFANNGKLLRIEYPPSNGNPATTAFLEYESDRLARVTDGSHFISFDYNGQGQISRVWDQAGRSISYDYNYDTGKARLTWVKDVRGGIWRYEYWVRDTGQTPYLTKILNPLGNIVQEQLYNFSSQFSVGNDTPYVTDQYNGAGEHVAQFGYYSRCTRVGVTNGTEHTYHYDANNAFVGESLGGQYVGASYRISDKNYRPMQSADANGNASIIKWTNDGRYVLSITDPLRNTTSFAYQGYDEGGNRISDLPTTGNPLSVIDARGNKTEYIYGNTSFPTLATQIIRKDHTGAILETTLQEYNANGYLSKVTTQSDMVTEYIYGATLMREPSEVRVYNVNNPGNVLTTTYEYDSVGRVIKEIDPLGRVQRTFYDPANHVTRTITNYVADVGNSDPLNWIWDSGDRHWHYGSGMDEVDHGANKDQNIITVSEYDLASRLTSVTGMNGKTVYLYDKADRLLASIENYTGSEPVTSVTWDNGWLVNGVAVGHGAGNDTNIVAARTYDVMGNVQTVRDVTGRVTWTGYDDLNRPVVSVTNYHSVTSPLDWLWDGTSWVYNNDPISHGANNDENIITRMTYDSNGNVITSRAVSGVETRFLYDALNRQVAIIYNYQDGIHHFGNPNDPNDVSEDPGQDVITQIYYDQLGNVVRTIDPATRSTITCYDDLQRPVKQIVNSTNTSADAACASSTVGIAVDQDIVTQLVYDTQGHLQNSIDPDSRLTWFCYDDFNRLVQKVVNPATNNGADLCNSSYTGTGGSTDKDIVFRYQYDTVGRTIRTTDKTGISTAFGYDQLDREIQIIENVVDIPTDLDAENITLQIEYNSHGQIKKQIDPNQNVTQFTYDQLGRLVETTNPLGKQTSAIYDLSGNTTQVENELGEITSYTYDSLNRQTSIITPTSNPFLSIHYQVPLSLGQHIQGTDANGIVSDYFYNALGQLVNMTENVDSNGSDPDRTDQNLVTEYKYKVTGVLKRVSLPDDKSIKFAYDALDRRIVYTDLMGSKWSTEYDKVGRIVRQFDPNGNTTSFNYDSVDRLTNVDYSNQFTPDVHYTYDVRGRMQTMLDGHGTTQFTYDALDRIKTINDPEQGTTTYDYDAGGRRTQLVMPDSKSIAYHYDANNRLTSVKSWDTPNSESDPELTDVSYDYDDANRLKTVELANGVTTSFDYDADGRLTGLTSMQGDNQLMKIDYYLDAVGNRLAAEEQIATAAVTPPPVPDPLLSDTILFGELVQDGIGAHHQLMAYSIADESVSNLSNNGYDEYDGVWSPDGRKIAFISNRAGGKKLFVLDVETQTITQLTFDIGLQPEHPVWSPDQSWLGFSSGGNIYLVHADSTPGDPLLLTTGKIFDWSTSNQILYENYTDNTLATLDVQTGSVDTFPVSAQYAAWSPDEAYIAYYGGDASVAGTPTPEVDNPALYVIDLADRNQTLISTQFISGLDWSPEDNHILYSVDKTIFVVDTAADPLIEYAFKTFDQAIGRVSWSPGTNVPGIPNATATPTTTPTTTDTPTLTSTPTLPPGVTGENRIVYSVNVHNASDDTSFRQVMSRKPDGSESYQLTGVNAPDRDNIQPAWSSDAENIAYVSALPDTTDYQLHVMTASGSDDLTVASISGKGIFNPVWSPDDQKIVFFTLDLNDYLAKFQLYEVEYDGVDWLSPAQIVLDTDDSSDGDGASDEACTWIGATALDWSITDDVLVYRTIDETTTCILDLDSEIARQADLPQNISQLHWSSVDNKLAYFNNETDKIQAVPVDASNIENGVIVDTGNTQDLLTLTGVVGSFDWSPDADYLVYEISDHVFVAEIGGAQPPLLVAGPQAVGETFQSNYDDLDWASGTQQPVPTVTATASETPELTVTPVPSETPINTLSATPTRTPSLTHTPTPSRTPSTATPTADATPACVNVSTITQLIDAIDSANNQQVPARICLTPDATFNFKYFEADGIPVPENNALPVITGNITIEGNGSTFIRASESDNYAWFFRFFEVSNTGTLYLQDVTFNNGGFASASEEDTPAIGGSILNNGHAVLTDILIQDSKADWGGAIYNVGDLTLQNVTIKKSISKQGGAIYNTGMLFADSTTLINNNATTGGAVYNQSGSAEFNDSKIQYNTAAEGAGINAFG